MYARICKRPRLVRDFSITTCCRAEASTSSVATAGHEVPKPPLTIAELRQARVAAPHLIQSEMERQVDEGFMKQQLESLQIKEEVEELKKAVRGRRWNRNVLDALEPEGSTQSKQTAYASRKSLHNPQTAESITLSHLVAAQLHLGHSMSSLSNRLAHTSIYGIRHRQYPYIDLRQTLIQLRRAAMVVREVVEDDGLVLFVSGKSLHPLDQKRRELACRNAAEKLGRSGYSVTKWIGGSLSNTSMVLGKSEHSGLRTANLKKEDARAFLAEDFGRPGPFPGMKEFMEEVAVPIEDEQPLTDENGGAAEARLFKRVLAVTKEYFETRLGGFTDRERVALFAKLNVALRDAMLSPEKQAELQAATDPAKTKQLIEKVFDGQGGDAAQVLGKLAEGEVEKHELAFKPRLASSQFKFTAWDFKPSLVVLMGPLKTMGWAAKEATQAGIPTIGIVDTDGDPRSVTWPIVGNAESTRGIELIAGILGKAGEEGKNKKIDKRRQFRANHPAAEMYWYDQARRAGIRGFEDDVMQGSDRGDDAAQNPYSTLRPGVSFAEHFMVEQMKQLGLIAPTFGYEDLLAAREITFPDTEVGDMAGEFKEKFGQLEDTRLSEKVKDIARLARGLRKSRGPANVGEEFEELREIEEKFGLEPERRV
ncbi:ribosomal protein S2 [Atractiella rhizophila]|nr:ribosomal protein S2 [Atractiella rhizophila]